MELILKFFIYSVLGCILEVAWGFLIHRKMRSRRMLLLLPMCPVYGVAGVLMSLLLGGFRDNTVLLYILGALLASAVELLFFLIFRHRFSLLPWDYRHKKANLMGGICMGYSTLWGILAVLFVQYLDPFVSRLLAAQSDYGKLVTAVFLAVIMLSDIKSTTAVFSAYASGERDELPDCFGYMKRSTP